MIRYTLCCDEGHRFQSWFGDSLSFDSQAMRGLVVCPVCDSAHVVKAIMAPAVVAGRGVAPRVIETAQDGPETGPAADSSTGDAVIETGRREMRDVLRAVREQVLAETADVGRAFPEAARRIHQGDAAPRRIRGEATLDEARDLIEDGILILPVPADPDRLN